MHTGFEDDGYFGSGKRLKSEVKKYGKENFKKEILEVCLDRKSLELREAEIVNEEFLIDPLCLNLKNGGEGGGKFSSNEHQKKCATAGGQIGGKTAGKLNGAANLAKARGAGKYCGPDWTGKKHSEKARDKMILSQQNIDRTGNKNPMFGRKFAWVSKRGEVKKIPLEDLDHYLNTNWIRGIKRIY